MTREEIELALFGGIGIEGLLEAYYQVTGINVNEVHNIIYQLLDSRDELEAKLKAAEEDARKYKELCK